MKTIKTATQPALKDLFTVGAKMGFARQQFDGRTTETTYVLVKVVKVNRTTVDVETTSGTVMRLDAFDQTRLLKTKRA